MEKDRVFHLFRYQILPTTQNIQMAYTPYKINNINDLISQKNKIFKDTLKSFKKFEYTRTELVHRLSKHNDCFFLSIAVNRNLKRSKKDFTVEEIDNWPPTSVIINNQPDAQLMMVEFNRSAFADTRIVANIIQDTVNEALKKYQLAVCVEKLFEEQEFWALAEKYKTKIIQADFELISPNMSNISDALKLDLKQLSKNTNTQKTHLQLNSDKNSCLALSAQDDFIHSLVTYASKGGGNIALKIKGYSKKFHTQKTSKEIAINEMELIGKSPKDIVDLLRSIAGLK